MAQQLDKPEELHMEMRQRDLLRKGRGFWDQKFDFGAIIFSTSLSVIFYLKIFFEKMLDIYLVFKSSTHMSTVTYT